MKIGVLSDTHDFLDPRIVELFQGVDHILHAGDVGMQIIVFELEQIAPTTAVLGNTDLGNPLRLTELVTLGDLKFLVQHIVNPYAPDEKLQGRLIRTLRFPVPGASMPAAGFGRHGGPFMRDVSTLFRYPDRQWKDDCNGRFSRGEPGAAERVVASSR